MDTKAMIGALPRTGVMEAAVAQVAEVEAGIEAALDVLAAADADPALARRLRFVLHAALEAATDARETLAVGAPNP
jgi:hypothetical protein